MTFAWAIWFCLSLLPLGILLPKLLPKAADTILTIWAVIALVLLLLWAFGVNPPPIVRVG